MTAMRTLLYSLVCVLGVSCCADAFSAPSIPSEPSQPKILESPDGQREARIAVANAAGEMILELLDAHGHVLLHEDYTSPDKNGGLMLAQAKWTQDSQFFVYSTWHAQGHQATNSPTFIYSRDANRIFNLEDRVGYIDVSDFMLTPSDVINTDVFDVKKQESHKVSVALADLFQARTVTFNDSQLVTQTRSSDELDWHIPQIDLESKLASIFTVTRCKWISGMTCRVSFNGKLPLPSEVFFEEYNDAGNPVGSPRRLIYPELEAGHTGLATFNLRSKHGRPFRILITAKWEGPYKDPY